MTDLSKVGRVQGTKSTEKTNDSVSGVLLKRSKSESSLPRFNSSNLHSTSTLSDSKLDADQKKIQGKKINSNKITPNLLRTFSSPNLSHNRELSSNIPEPKTDKARARNLIILEPTGRTPTPKASEESPNLLSNSLSEAEPKAENSSSVQKISGNSSLLGESSNSVWQSGVGKSPNSPRNRNLGSLANRNENDRNVLTAKKEIDEPSENGRNRLFDKSTVRENLSSQLISNNDFIKDFKSTVNHIKPKSTLGNFKYNIRNLSNHPRDNQLGANFKSIISRMNFSEKLNLSTMDKDDLKSVITDIYINKFPEKCNGAKSFDRLPRESQNIINEMTNMVHSDFQSNLHQSSSNKAHGETYVDGKDAHENPINIKVPTTINMNGVEYSQPKHLASGGLGHALRYTNIQTGETVIVKLMKENSPEKRNEMITEFKAHQEAQGENTHKNIVGLKGLAIGEDDTLFLVMDEAKGGGMDRLADNVRNNDKISEKTKELLNKSMLKDMMEGVAHMHERGVMHLDLKEENVFVNADGSGVVGDFGLSKGDNFLSGRFETTPEIVSPEIAANKQIVSKESDIWAMGLSAFRLFEGKQGISLFFKRPEMGPDKFAENSSNKVYVTNSESILNEFDPKIEEGKESKQKLQADFESDYLKLNAPDLSSNELKAKAFELFNKKDEIGSKMELIQKAYDAVPSKENEEKLAVVKAELRGIEQESNIFFDKYPNTQQTLIRLKRSEEYLSKLESKKEEVLSSTVKDKIEPKHEIVNALMHPDPTQRPELKDVLKHSYFQDSRLESPKLKELKMELLKKPAEQDPAKIERLSKELDEL